MRVSARWASPPEGIAATHLESTAVQCGLTPVDGQAEIDLQVVWSDDPSLAYDFARNRSTDEIYLVDATRNGATLTVSGARSLRWALSDVAARLRSRRWTVGRSRHAPDFRLRGLIEGFYGSPWSEEARLSMIDFAASVRLNTFLYSPKDDPFLRSDWRSPFDERSRSRLEAVAGRCRERDIDPMVGISPGLTMSYSDGRDVDLLVDKALSTVDAGAARLALLLDDIPERLQHPGDIEAFPDLATAHAQVANRLHASVDVPVVVCPTMYRGSGDEPYVSRLGELLEPSIDLFWTGRAICSPAITAAEAAHFTRASNRPPLYWDNYPVNDLSMRHEMHIGPYRNRDPLLGRFSRGVMANAMEYPEASKIPLATIADFLWDAGNYDPESSWERAITRVAGEQDAAPFLLFADNLRMSCLSEGDPRRLTRMLEDHAFQRVYGSSGEAQRVLATFADDLLGAADHLLGSDIGNPQLQDELEPWLRKFRLGAEALRALAAEEPPRVLSDFLAHLTDDPVRVFGDVLEMTLTEATDGKESTS